VNDRIAPLASLIDQLPNRLPESGRVVLVQIDSGLVEYAEPTLGGEVVLGLNKTILESGLQEDQ
jgi:hypothetical protein